MNTSHDDYLPPLSKQMQNLMGLAREPLVEAVKRVRLKKIILPQNPGKIVIMPRQSGKTTALCEYVMENFTYGAVIVCLNAKSGVTDIVEKIQWAVGQRDRILIIPQDRYERATVAMSKPIFADEMLYIDIKIRRLLWRDPRLMGGVSSAVTLTDLDEGELEKCILY